jgi:hypothetical protein
MRGRTWVYDPHSGGRKIPPAVRERTEMRIMDHAQKHYSGKYFLRFGLRCSVAWTLHPTPIEAHAWSRIGDPGGEAHRLRVLEAHPCPRAGLLMTSTSKVRCLQARGRGRVARGRAPCARKCRRGSGSPRPIKRSGLPGHRAHDRRPFRARGRPGTTRSSRAQALAAPVGRRAHGSRSLKSRSRRSAGDRTPSPAAA